MNKISKDTIQSMIFFVGISALILGILAIHNEDSIGTVLIIQGLAMTLKVFYYQVK